MRDGWSKVTRWAGIGHNGKDRQNTGVGEAMVDEMEQKDGQDVEMGQGTVEPEQQNGADGNDASAQQQAQIETLQQELAQLRGERDQAMDRLVRLQAEFDNARKREAKERADAREYTVGATIEPFLGVMDNFGLALKASGSVEQLRGGVELIVKQMEDALRGLNVVAVETVGQQFDPRIHEALGSIETVEHPDHQVLEEIRKGYKLREKLLRPALVKIASNPAMVTD